MVDRTPAVKPQTTWRKNKGLLRAGYRDLEYLPRSRAGWNATLAAHAFSMHRRLAGKADLNTWAIMHGRPASKRYAQLKADALVLWHGTSAARASKIEEHGIFHKRGVWATLEPKIAHGFSRYRGSAYGSSSATVAFVLDRSEIESGLHFDWETPDVVRFHSAIPVDVIEFILYDDRIEHVGRERVKRPRPWAVARFKKRGGQWVPRSQPPVRFDDENVYKDKAQWLRLSICRILSFLERATAIEIFSPLYSTIVPWDALAHDEVFAALEHLTKVCGETRGYRQFALLERNDG
jgi:hypothetical protein